MSPRLCFALLVGMALSARVASGATAQVQWPGTTNITFSGAVDPHGAAGPQGILEVANTGIKYYSKLGARLWTTNEQDFFLPSVCCDAKALFDPASQRFFVIGQDGIDIAVHVAVSRSSNPASGSTNDWLLYRFPTSPGIDYPGIGMDAQALYVTYQLGNACFVINKADLLAGNVQPSTFTRVTPTGNSFATQGWQASTVIGSGTPGNVAYSVAHSSFTTITLYAVTNVLNNPGVVFTNLPCPSLGNPAAHLFAPQLGTTNRLIDAFGVPMGNAFWRAGDLWFCGAVGSSNQPQRTVIRYYRIKTGGFPFGQASLAEVGDLDGGPNTWRQHPAIAGNTLGDVCLVFTETSSNTFNTLLSSIRRAGTTNFETVHIRTSTASWTTDVRWADYSVVTPDPVDQSFWVSHLTIPTSTSLDIWWAQARDNVFHVDKNAVGVEVGSYEFPFHTLRAAHTAATGAKTFVIKPANYPEPTLPLRLDKNVRLENPYPSGTVHIGP